MSVELEFDGNTCHATVRLAHAPNTTWHSSFDFENPVCAQSAIEQLIEKITEGTKVKIMLELAKRKLTK